MAEVTEKASNCCKIPLKPPRRVLSPDGDSQQQARAFCAKFGPGVGKKVMVGRSLMLAVVVLLCLADMVGPILVDARHWWPRKPKRRT